MLKNIAVELQSILEGDVNDNEDVLKEFSVDASIFRIKPQAVVFPKNTEDIKKLVKFVSDRKADDNALAITPRAAGTDMTGGVLSESIVVGFTKYLNKIKELTDNYVITEPGVYYRDFEKEAFKKGAMLPTYPASKSLNALGGMVGNNSGGEKSLRYGKTIDFVEELKIVLSDGNEYIFKPLSKEELEQKMNRKDGASIFEANLYKNVFNLLEENYEKIQAARPNVAKNSAGYNLWDVWNKKTFDLTKLIVGSQGTLGIVTEIKFRLVPVSKYSKMLVVFLSDLKILPELVNVFLKYKPESLETYDDHTLKFALRFFPDLIKAMHLNIFSFFWRFLSEIRLFIKSFFTGSLPKLIILAEFTGNNEEEISQRIEKANQELEKFNIRALIVSDEKEAQKYWAIRRESFNLLRKHIKDKKTAPFIDDFIIQPQFLPQFLPQLDLILKQYPFIYTIAGHVGSGNFHIIPLMDLKDKKEREIIPELSEKVYDLVLSYKGSITAEHNDGLIRSPFLEKMYGKDIVKLFEEIKDMFDPQNIFNPGKKVYSDFEYAMKHINIE